VTPVRIVVASQNPDKIREVEAVISAVAPRVEIVRGLEWPEVEETEPTLEGNALLKARAVFAFTGIAALADDTGLEVRALGGEPGVHTARFAGPNATYEDNVAHLLERLRGVADRSATFRTAVVLVDGSGGTMTAEGRLDGRIAEAGRGDGGFGYDPVFEVDGRTLAEIGEDEKNLMSHRARALHALAETVWGAEA
jgi:XTP/dITP diphosphohydrolase